MKIKILKDYQSLKKDQVIENMCPITGGFLIENGIAVNMDAPVVEAAAPMEPIFVPDNELKGCSADVIEGIAKAEKIEGYEDMNKGPRINAIITQRMAFIAAKKQCEDAGVEGFEDMSVLEMLAAVDQKEFDDKFGDRTECDDRCEYSDVDNCDRIEGVLCPLDKPEEITE